MDTLFFVLKFINTFIFVVIACFHFYWAFGGKFGGTSVIPSIKDKAVFSPSPIATISVAIAMLLASYFSWMPLLTNNATVLLYGNLGIAIVFCLRAIGDFNYVGFFKQVKGTLFAKNDTYFFSPLCLLIAGIAFSIYLIIKP